MSLLELSLMRVQRLDASGVVALVRLYSWLAQAGIRLALIDVRDTVVEELERLNLTRLIPIGVVEDVPNTLELVLASYEAMPSGSFEVRLISEEP